MESADGSRGSNERDNAKINTRKLTFVHTIGVLRLHITETVINTSFRYESKRKKTKNEERRYCSKTITLATISETS